MRRRDIGFEDGSLAYQSMIALPICDRERTKQVSSIICLAVLVHWFWTMDSVEALQGMDKENLIGTWLQ